MDNNNNIIPSAYAQYPQNCEKFLRTSNGQILFATKESLARDQVVIQERNQQHQLIQTIVAISALKETLVTTLLFKGAYLSVFAKGDDQVIFDRFKNARSQLGQVLEEQTVTKNYLFSVLSYSPQTLFQDIANEIIEHFQHTIDTILQCISGRSGSTTVLESVSQKWRWAGWKQIGMSAICSLNSVYSLVTETKKKFSDDASIKAHSGYLDEFMNIALCFRDVIAKFMNREYPTPEIILKHFPNDVFITKENLAAMNIDAVNDNSNPSEAQKKRGMLSYFFGGLNE